MTRYTKRSVTSLAGINSELIKIQTALVDTLSRKGDAPNQMEGTLDMNSNRILNLPDPIADHEPFRKGDLPIVVATLQPLVDQATSQANRAGQEADRAANEADGANNARHLAVSAANDARQSAVSANDAALQLNEVLDDAVASQMIFPLDLGFIYQSPISNSFDLGGL